MSICIKNRIEEKMSELKKNKEKAFITYMTAGLPNMEGCKELIKTQEQAGTDLLELGIPFSDPTADGPVIQAASFKAIKQGVNLKGVFKLMKEVRAEGVKLPIIFMLYYNTVLYYGLEDFINECITSGVDGIIIPDLPMEEQAELQECIAEKEMAPIMIQLVSPVSGRRIKQIVERAKGFVYCISGMGVTGQSQNFHKEIVEYLKEVKKNAKVPVMMGFGIEQAKDVEPMKNIIDGAIVGSHFIRLMEKTEYNKDEAARYCSTFKRELNLI